MALTTFVIGVHNVQNRYYGDDGGLYDPVATIVGDPDTLLRDDSDATYAQVSTRTQSDGAYGYPQHQVWCRVYLDDLPVDVTVANITDITLHARMSAVSTEGGQTTFRPALVEFGHEPLTEPGAYPTAYPEVDFPSFIFNRIVSDPFATADATTPFGWTLTGSPQSVVVPLATVPSADALLGEYEAGGTLAMALYAQPTFPLTMGEPAGLTVMTFYKVWFEVTYDDGTVEPPDELVRRPYCRIFPREDRYSPSRRQFPPPMTVQTPGRITGYI